MYPDKSFLADSTQAHCGAYLRYAIGPLRTGYLCIVTTYFEEVGAMYIQVADAPTK